ncbi:MAG TPA: LamG domain-containing protein [Kofleriaceae bacterium]
MRVGGSLGMCLVASAPGCRLHFDPLATDDGGAAMGDGSLTTRTPDPAVLYLFDQGAGDTVRDRILAPLDLQIEDPAAATWFEGGLRFDVPNRMTHLSLASKIVTPCLASGEITIEAWVKTPHAMQPGTTGPFRIVALSFDAIDANFMLGQEVGGLYFRLRTTTGGTDGEPGFVMPFMATTTPLHVVMVHAKDGTELLYLNNQLAALNTRSGAMTNWDGSYKLVMGNERVDDRPWLGDFHLVAIYPRALTADEIDANFTAGPDPEL